MKSKKILSLLLVLCMAIFVIPFSAGASEAKDVADTLTEEMGVPAAAAEAVAEGQQVPENFAASVAYVSDYAGLKAAVEDPVVTIVVVLNNITLEDTLTMDGNNLDLALIALNNVTIYSANERRHFFLADDPAIATERESKLIFSNVTLDGNGTGGGIVSNRGADSQTTLLLDGLEMTNCGLYDLDFNAALKGFRVTLVDSKIYSNPVSGVDASNLTVENSEIKNNGGSGIESFGYDLQVINSEISGNVQRGIHVMGYDSAVYIDGCTVKDNGSNGIYINVNSLGRSGETEGIYNTTVSGNGTAGNVEQGGGVYIATVYGSVYGMENCMIDGNTAFDGGGIYARFMQLGIVDCEVKNNIAERGAGVFHDEFIEGNYAGTKIYDNTAFEGAGVYFYNPSGYERHAWIEAEVYNNEASYNGGGIYVDADLVVHITGDVHGNTARTRGGGVYVTNSSSIEVTGSIYDNSARQGADIWPIQ